MKQYQDARNAGLPKDCNVVSTDVLFLSHCTDCRSERVKLAETMTTSYERPRPGRRRLSIYDLPLTSTHLFLFVTLTFLVLGVPTDAAEHGVSQSRAVKGNSVDGRVVFDHHPIPQPMLHRRDGIASTDEVSTTAVAEAPAPSNLYSSIDTGSLPRAFDSGFGSNYTQPSCPTFLRSMVNNDTFISCVPFSLLLQNSISFFDASRSLSTITTVLNASCSVSFPTCSTLMSSFAVALRSSTACQEDYNSENAEVRQAYAGLLAYDVSHNASCLKNVPTPSDPDKQQDNTNYCFANAVTNRTSPTDSYIYFLPMGTPLPSGSLPTCDYCLAQTMGVYAAAASNKSQPLNFDYVDSANLINRMCGPSFVNANIPNAGSSSSGGAGGGGNKKTSAALRDRGLDGKGRLGLSLVGAVGLLWIVM